jgi:hypothetical protein
MKKFTLLFAAFLLIAGCSQKKTLTANLEGNWYVYKLIQDNIDKTATAPYSDTIKNYSVSFTSDGKFIEQNIWGTDTVLLPGTWEFQDANEKLALTDTVYKKRVYTIFNLEGNHVELRRNGQNRYLRKF